MYMYGQNYGERLPYYAALYNGSSCSNLWRDDWNASTGTFAGPTADTTMRGDWVTLANTGWFHLIVPDFISDGKILICPSENYGAIQEGQYLSGMTKDGTPKLNATGSAPGYENSFVSYGQFVCNWAYPQWGSQAVVQKIDDPLSNSKTRLAGEMVETGLNLAQYSANSGWMNWEYGANHIGDVIAYDGTKRTVNRSTNWFNGSTFALNYYHFTGFEAKADVVQRVMMDGHVEVAGASAGNTVGTLEFCASIFFDYYGSWPANVPAQNMLYHIF